MGPRQRGAEAVKSRRSEPVTLTRGGADRASRRLQKDANAAPLALSLVRERELRGTPGHFTAKALDHSLSLRERVRVRAHLGAEHRNT